MSSTVWYQLIKTKKAISASEGKGCLICLTKIKYVVNIFQKLNQNHLGAPKKIYFALIIFKLVRVSSWQ